jgi:vancomycin resistance protein YoaR
MNIRLLIALVLNSILLSTAVIAQDISAGTTTLGAYETHFHYTGEDIIRSRAYNVRRAMRKLDGTILRPEQSLSYNRLLGPRTAARGWRQAKTILNGEIFIAPGGGICQVSSTLHAAAIFSGMEILNAQHHSRYMTYIDPGLDATVNWTEPDLVIRNPYNFPVRIHAWEREPGVAAVEFLGEERIWEITVETIELERRRHKTETRERSDLPTSYRHVLEKGTNFLLLEQWVHRRNLYTEELFSERRRIQYEPSPRIIEVGTMPEAEE